MKSTAFLMSLSFLTISAFAGTQNSFKVLLRQEGSSRTYFQEKELQDLTSTEAFDGKYFKIVKAKSNEAISFNEQDPELILKAATVYYHLTEARNFWITKMRSDVALNAPKMVIRLEIKNQFDELGHFAHDNRSPQFNNALSVPEGETPPWVPAGKQDKWGREVWFRPIKMILSSELPPLGPNPLTTGLMALEKPLLNYTLNQINISIIERLFYPSYASGSTQKDILQYAGSYALLKVFISGSKHADALFLEKYFYLDTAMVPEVTYHEYAHVILSDRLTLTHSTPVNEGMADYFAAVQSQKRKIYAKVAGYSNAESKDTQEKQKYNHWNESNRNATADFTLSVLWDVRETLGEEIGDQVVYEARKYLKTESSTISDGLLRAILLACETKCESPRRDKLKLYETFAWKGF